MAEREHGIALFSITLETPLDMFYHFMLMLNRTTTNKLLRRDTTGHR